VAVIAGAILVSVCSPVLMMPHPSVMVHLQLRHASIHGIKSGIAGKP
jgi:hypothetical protein